MMPLHGLNTVLETLVSQVAGSIGDPKMIELCGIYLVRGRYLLTLIYIPLFFVVMYSNIFWRWIYLVENREGKVVVDQEALMYAKHFLYSYFIGSYFAALNDLQFRFLHCMGKSRDVLMS